MVNLKQRLQNLYKRKVQSEINNFFRKIERWVMRL